jgi:arylsulfatase A
VQVSFNHIHEPNACSAAFCGRSRRGAIGDAVEEVDWAVGKIMRALKQSGADDNTLVLFTSDNGSPVHGDPEVSVGRFQP